MDVAIVGDGPGGLSAALFLAKNGLSVTVYGEDKTAMHWALLKNYLGFDEIHGSEFQKRARAQVLALGAKLVAERVETITRGAQSDSQQFELTLEAPDKSSSKVSARYVILSEGKSPRLAKQLGLQFDEAKGIATDRNGCTSIAGVYAVGRLARPGRSQAIISAGDGAAAAIDILSKEKGQDFADWDSPPESA
ncbi:MAG TPA: FAD-dependent oxidoreductase [Polyangiaceae bacterium]|jgi:thioredoxin reductase|nr:FAD-dependent oxidoreductase [Polyangiaceae bacterium]